MLVILPISGVDEQLAVELAGFIADSSGAVNHPLHLLFDQSTSGDAVLEILALTRPVFKSVEHSAMQAPGAWPIAAGFLFRHASLVAETRGMPWYFCEADSTPMRATFLDELEDEYLRGGKPCMGAVEKHWLGSTQRIPDGDYLMGSAVYPADLRRYTRMHLNPSEVPFDVAMRHDLKGHVHATPLIQNCWRTRNYREQDGEIVCDAAPARQGQAGDSLVRKVDPRAAIVHGVKDASLIKVLRMRNRDIPSVADAKAAVATV